MGRRSRKRGGAAAAAGTSPPARLSSGGAERPQALWHPVPLTELLILAGIGLMVWGFTTPGGGSNARIAAGLAVASIGGLELALREHITGFRSHTTLLAGLAAIGAMLLVGPVAGVRTLGVVLAAGVGAGTFAWWSFRLLFRARAGRRRVR